MKKVIFTLAIAAIAFTANAQDKKGSDKTLKFGIGLNAGIPIGDAKNFSSFVIGGDVQGEYAAADQVGITLNAGYLKFTSKNGYSMDGVIPVLAGAKIYFSDNKVFAHAQLGMTFSTASGGGSAFTYAPGFGYQASENFDVTVKYQAFTKNSFTTSFIGVRAAYTF